MVDARMEKYNYYRDSRVQGGMFSACWKLDESGDSDGVISFEDGWVAEQLEEEAFMALADYWVDEEQGSTQTYRRARDGADCLEKDRQCVKDEAMESEGVEYHWQVSDEVKADLNARYEILKAARSITSREMGKLYELAAEQIDKTAILKDKGLLPDGRIKVQMKYEVCGMCRGSGKTTNPNIDCGGISREDFDEDPDFEEEYFAGKYDITCVQCKGLRVESMPVFPEWLEAWIQSRDESQMDGIREQCAELAMGA